MKYRTTLRESAVAVLVVCTCGCDARPPFVVLTIKDPAHVADGFTTLRLGRTLETLKAAEIDASGFPLTITVEGPQGEHSLWAEAHDDEGMPLGRGTITATFKRKGTPTATIELARACDTDAECNDGLFCTGAETCVDDMCASGSSPCAANVECAISTCVDLGSGAGTCDVTVDHLLCDTGSYCNPTRGCVEGRGCQQTTDCVDGFVCNGEEQCINLVCGPGQPPDLNDGDICTLDGCDDARVAGGEEAVFHVALTTLDGSACTIPNSGDPGTAGVCVAAEDGCVVSQCGDGVTADDEECDDGNGDDLDSCRSTCLFAFCGDGVVESGVDECDDGGESMSCNVDCTTARCGDRKVNATLGEECDADGETAQCNTNCTFSVCGDGELNASAGEVCDDHNTASGDGCRGDCRKVEVCGDQLLDAGEDCDDGNANPADGCDACVATHWLAEAIVGGSTLATTAGLASPRAVVTDGLGNLFIADAANHRIVKVAADTGVTSTVAGTGTPGYSGDGSAATNAQLNYPNDLAVDGLGNLFIADGSNHRVRKVAADTGVITSVAGTGSAGYSGDGVQATSAQLSSPSGLELDGLGNLWIGDSGNHRVRKVEADSGLISTVAGTGTAGYSGDGVPATSAQLYHPGGLAFDDLGNLFITDRWNHRIRKVDVGSGLITTVAGTGTGGYTGDGVPATSAQLQYPADVLVDRYGLYIADTTNHRVRWIAHSNGVIRTFVGTGIEGYSGDGGAPSVAQLNYPQGLALDGSGILLIADSANHRVRQATPEFITTIAGTGVSSYLGDGSAATSATLSVTGLALDQTGNLFIADRWNDRIRKVAADTGVISTVAGTGTPGYSGDGEAATNAQLNGPRDVTVDELGNLFIADGTNHRIRKVEAGSGVITTVAGIGILGYSGDGGPATSAQICVPSGVALDGLGNLLIADSGNHRIRMVAAGTGVISTVAGTGAGGYSGDGVAATSAQLYSPNGVAVDGLDNLLIADTWNERIRKVAAGTGVISTVAGTGTQGDSGDGAAATSALLRRPWGVAVDGLGNVLIADTGNERIRRVAADTGIITTVAGTGSEGQAGDGAAATSAQLTGPGGVVVDDLGNLWIADNFRVREVAAGTGLIYTAAGKVEPERTGPLLQARLSDPRALAPVADFWVASGGTSGTVFAVRDSSDLLEVVVGRYPHSTATADLARFRDNAFGTIGGVAYDAANALLFVTESSNNRLHVVTVVDPADENTWTIADLAGDAATGGSGFADGAAADARFRNPTGLFFNALPRLLYIADTGNHVIRALDLDAGTVATPIGTPETLGFLGDDGLAAQALLYRPEAVTRCPNGDLFVADTGNHRIRRVHRVGSDDFMTTVLGDGTASSSGDGFPAWTFPAEEPRGLACDAFDNLFVTSTNVVRMLPATDSHVVDGEGPVQTIYGDPPRDTFPASTSECLTGLAVMDGERLRVTDACTGLLVELTRQPEP